jgi:hypothetical protein
MLLIFYSDCNKRMRDEQDGGRKVFLEDVDTCDCGSAL